MDSVSPTMTAANEVKAALQPAASWCIVLALAFLVGLILALPAVADPGTSGRPVLFVHGIWGNASSWDSTLGVADALATNLSTIHPDLYPDASRLEVFCDFNETAADKMVKVRLLGDSPDHPDTWTPLLDRPDLGNRRFFAISFYDPVTRSFDPIAVSGVSIVNKAAELSRVIRAITSLTKVLDVIIVAHSMGGLVTRAYIEGLLSSTPCGSIYACLAPPLRDPNHDLYTSDVGAVLTIDTPHAGASRADWASIADLVGLPPLLGTVNIYELEPESAFIHTLNYDPGVALYGVTARDLPPLLPIESLESFWSDFHWLGGGTYPYWDGLVLSEEQAVRIAIPSAKRTAGLVDIGNSFAMSSLPLACQSPLPLHFLGCVGTQDQTKNRVLHFVSSNLVGTLTRVTVSATIGGVVPWTGPVSFAVSGPPGAAANGVFTVVDSRAFYGQPLGAYTIQYLSGGPVGAGPPRITPGSTETLGSGLGESWNIAFSFNFTVPNLPPVPPALIAPGLPSFPGSSVSTLTPQFQWDSVPGADMYGLYIENSAGTQIFSNETLPGSSASFTLPAANSLTNGQLYNWSMRSHGPAGWGGRSERLYFSVAIPQNPRDFSLNLNPTTVAVTAGGAASLVVNTTTVSGTPQLVSFGAGGLPSGTNSTFSPTSATSGGSSTLTITTDPTTPGGVYLISVAGVSDALVTHLSHFALTVNPQVAGTPAVCLTPSSLAFSDQTAGTTSPSQLVTLRNCGTSSLRVTAIAASADFAIAPGSVVPPVDLPAGTSTTFQVVFAPQSGGSKSGQVQIFSNAPGSPHSVALRGSAIPAPATDGTVQVNATLNGQPYSGSVQFSLTQTPGGTLNGGSVPSTFTSRPPATYTVGLLAAPGGSTLVGVSPAATQILQAGGSLSFSLDFTAPNDYVLLAANPRARSVLAGNSTTYTVEVGKVKGGTQQITVSVSGLPSGASPSLNPQAIALTGATAASTLTVSTTPQTLPGIYALTITCTNQDGTSRSTPAVLSVVTPPTISLASIATSGLQGDGTSTRPAISADGRFLAFMSSAGNLTSDPPTGYPRIFVRDRQTGQTTLASVGDNGSLPILGAYAPSISGNGGYVVFHGDAGFAPGPVYVRDLGQRHTQLVSIAPDGTPANGSSCCASISADGRFVAFSSSATNLVPGGTHVPPQVFVQDLETGETELVSVASDGTPANAESSVPSLSADGRVVAFVSRATNLTADATNGPQIFVHDRATGQTSMASVALSGPPTGPVSTNLDPPGISADGRFVAFASTADNLVSGDVNPSGDFRVFRRDRVTNTTRRARIVSGALPKDDVGSSAPSLSSDGRFVVSRGGPREFGADQLLLWDSVADRTVVVSVAPDGSLGGVITGQSSAPAISADGQTITFSSTASSLAPTDTNGFEDVFVVGNPVRSGLYLKSLVLDMTTVTGGAVVGGTLTLSGPAAAGGATVALTSGGAEVQAPAIVIVPAGSTTIAFTLPTLPVSSQRAVTIVASFGGGSPFAVLTLNPATPFRVVARAGDLQSTPISLPFQTVFQAEVLDAVDNPVRGAAVIFAAPLAGASGTFANGTTSFVAATDANGLVTASTFTANSVVGSYLVTASVAGVSNRGYFFVTNLATHTLTVASVNPSSGVGITVSPVDTVGLGNGTTQFSRAYNHNAVVNLTAPAMAGGSTFQRWQRDGVDFSTNTAIQLAVDAAHTLTVIYASAPAPPGTFTDGLGPNFAISPGTTVIKAVHIVELRAAIDRLRAAKGLSAFNWTDPALNVRSTAVRAIHFLDLRTALASVCAAVPGKCTGYTDPTLNVGQTVIRAVHLNELRANVLALQ